MKTTLLIHNLNETEALGRKLGELLFPGAVLALVGTLGAGKTHLTRAIAEGLRVDHPEAVNSPTFVLIQEYDGPIPLYHFDTYRLPDARAFAALGAEEYLGGNGVCIIEWADKVQEFLPSEYLKITLNIVNQDARQMEFEAVGTRYEAIISLL